MRLLNRLAPILGNAYLLCLVLAISSQIRLSDALSISLASSNTALRVVQNMASVVAAPPNNSQRPIFSRTRRNKDIIDDDDDDVPNLEGIGGQVYANGKRDSERNSERTIASSLGLSELIPQEGANAKEQVWTALSRLEGNSKFV